uniref:DDRGK domain-containing protein 1 n=1 Tax=Ciona savignyi TaxID=51511 RepID=H2ZBC2_CIOSA
MDPGEENPTYFDESFKSTFGSLLSKNYFAYILFGYAGCIITVILFVIWRMRDYNRPDPSLMEYIDDEPRQRPTRANRHQTQARAGPVERAETVGGVRRRRRDGRGRNQQEVERQREEEVLDESGSEGEALPPAPVAGEGKMGAKKLRKLQEKEERRQMRQEMEIERAERKREQAEKEAMQKKLDELKKIEEEKKAEEEKKIQEEKERKEHEEYLKLKEMFSVDDEGQAAITSEEQSQNLLQEFVQYIKDTKVVLLEDLASHFGMRTQQAIDRVHDMLKDEIITGVIDDRGKFIYI